MGMTWQCPKCKEKSACFCNSCTKRDPNPEMLRVISTDDDDLQCPHCGHKVHIYLWEEEGIKEEITKESQ